MPTMRNESWRNFPQFFVYLDQELWRPDKLVVEQLIF